MTLQKSPNGFTQGEIYKLCGREDAVSILTFRPNSESAAKFGDDVTVSLVYTRKERTTLEQDSTAFDKRPLAKAKNLLYDEDKAKALMENGFNPKDVISIIVFPNLHKENTFTSSQDRKLNTLNIPFEPEGEGKDIGWMFGFLDKCSEEGIGLTPEESAQYLAYKLILNPDGLSEEEKTIIFNDKGQIASNEVAWFYLQWRKDANKLTDNYKEHLAKLSYDRLIARIVKLDELLKGIGGLLNFGKKYSEKCRFLIDKVMHFHEKRYNVVGKHILYMDLDGFLHIYLRHVRELTVAGLYSERTKFQLEEKDVETVINHVLTDLNDEYQTFKDEHPDWAFKKYSDEAYYYNGDYYHIDIDKDGRLVTFYKESERR